MNKKAVHLLIRCGLTAHGVIHVAETLANIYEKAWISATLSALAALLMLSGAWIDKWHDKENKNPKENK